MKPQKTRPYLGNTLLMSDQNKQEKHMSECTEFNDMVGTNF